jgi:hypothetical protein
MCLAAGMAPAAFITMITQIIFMSTAKFTYTAAFLACINRVISQERLSRYLTATKGDIGGALELYEYNIAISEALFGFLHGLEVAVRNSIHSTLRRDLGTPTWFDGGAALPWSTTGETLALTAVMSAMVTEAKAKLPPTALPGKLIAELTFGFWPNTLTKRFHSILWLPSLHKAFPNATVPRSAIHLRLEVIRRLRNRIAHHEPILTSHNEVYTGFKDQPYIALSSLLECVEWVSEDAALWLKAQTRYRWAEELLLVVSKKGITI